MSSTSVRLRLLMRVAGTLLVGALALPAAAGADVFGPMSLVSQGALSEAAGAQQADYAHDPVIAGDGRYVVFDGAFGSFTGVWRRDLASSAVEPVAVGAAGTPAGSAELPSVSADGRWVSFTTTAQLAPGDTNQGPDVYVRDMQAGAGEPAYRLVSAASGTSEALNYETTDPQHYGAVASGRSAITADGRFVAFVSTATSNLAGPHTPAFQVAVRDLQTSQTQLVSALAGSTGQPVPIHGEGATAVGAVYGANKPFPVALGGAASGQGASISADGSTVAWLGQQIEKQAAVLSAEANVGPEYVEPLWRRIADGPGAPTRRVTGGGDPASAACAGSGETRPALPPTLADACQGPFDTKAENGGSGTWTLGSAGVDYLPQLSRDGQTVAFLATAREVASGEEFRSAQSSDDLYVVDMASGLTRVTALRRLSEIASNGLAGAARVDDLAVSPDGTQVALSTARTQFALAWLTAISQAPGEPGMHELFDIDLANDTLTRVTQGVEGGPSESPHRPVSPGIDPYPGSAGASSPSFSSDGNLLAFASTASNLVYGDGNTPPREDPNQVEDGSDAFVVPRLTFAAASPQQAVSPTPEGLRVEPAWLMNVTASSEADGSVLLRVGTPAAGRLLTLARAAIVVHPSTSAETARRRRRRRARRARAAGHVNVETVVVANSVTATSGGTTLLRLRLAPQYANLAAQPGGLSAFLLVNFFSEGPGLKRELQVTFARPAHATKARRASHTRRARRSSARRRRAR